MTQTPFISIIICAYNEAERLPKSLKEIGNFLESWRRSYEIIVVDDGSRDGTARVASEHLAGVSHFVLSERNNRGKGYAVRTGMLHARGTYILFTDADLSTPIHELEKMIPFLEDGYDLAIGSRAIEAPEVKRTMIWYREIMGRTYNFLREIFIYPGISDSQCGFKCFRREAAKDLFSAQKLNGFSFDAEILYLARKRQYRIKEVPVSWYAETQSKVKIVKDSLNMFLDLIRIRWMHRRRPQSIVHSLFILI
ncbi:MAG: glycosyltransferase family 2 protein [Candidatus Omnitrophica bacterium]|nr:glycosyltransferase family 2 protein [Candidatus Omnitrophota bacterium]